MNSNHLNLPFPGADDADLREFAIAPIKQRRILVGGEIRDWTGPTKTVLSPVMVCGEDGNLTQIRLGSHPFGDVGSCVYRKFKLGRSDGEVRQGWRVI
jgi:glyceraldehyde-3-phosphate dehydrogenase (NADP+)